MHYNALHSIFMHIFVCIDVQNTSVHFNSRRLIMTHKIFVDGQEGTTGLRIHEYLATRSDLEVLKIQPEERKNPEARRILLNEADIAFLCLPDVASKESVSLIENDKTRIIDASTAFRTDRNWVYGIPELNQNQRGLIKNSSRVTVPGCHATGFTLSLYPLIQCGIVPPDYPVTCTSLTGYSGGGKKLIATFENGELSGMKSPKHYALNLNHKHLPEMTQITGLNYPPLFMPIIADYYNGMVTSIPLVPRLLNKKVSANDIFKLLSDYYANELFVHVMPFEEDTLLENGFLNTEQCINTNRFELFVFGNDDQILLMSRFDNLGKGASGAAIQNMNIMLGIKEDTGLIR